MKWIIRLAPVLSGFCVGIACALLQPSEPRSAIATILLCIAISVMFVAVQRQ